MRVFLVGDSIRMNAERHVRALLSDRISLISPSVNCESSRQVAEHIDAWAPAIQGDVVHLNCGLHDIRHDPGVDSPVCTLEQYRRNLGVIFGFLSARGAMVVWATSTPFLEDAHNAMKPSRRFLQHLLDYNAASRELASHHGFAINDLYTKLAGPALDDLMLPDGLHFNAVGNQRVAEMIAASISSAMMSSESPQLDTPQFKQETLETDSCERSS